MVSNGSFGIERELALGERLLWKGRPQKGIKIRPGDASGIRHGLVVCAVTILFAYAGLFQQTPPRNSVVAVVTILSVFGLLGFYLLIGRFLADAWTRSKMEYALTDQRAFIVTNFFRRKVRSIAYRSEPSISLAEHRDGSGTIYFGEQLRGKSLQQNSVLVSSRNLSAFDMIDNARDVYRRILKARNDSGFEDGGVQRDKATEGLSAVPLDSSFIIERELAPGERLLWKGRPRTGIKFRSSDAISVPAALIFCAAFFDLGRKYLMQESWQNGSAAILMFSLFVAFGIYATIGRFLVDAFSRSRMEYALTDRRALIMSNTFTRKVRSIDYRSEPNISLVGRWDGSGTIYFLGKPQGPITSSASLRAFDMIDGARSVYQTILKAKES